MLGERFYRFNKYCLYESSVRVPLILSGSAIDKRLRGKKDRRPAELVDIYPTLLGAAGIKVPGSAVGLNLLKDEKRSASFCALHERRKENAFMWRTADHKLILMMKGNRRTVPAEYTPDDIIGGEFYDLKKDRQEWNDLYSSDNPIVKKMTKELLAFIGKLNKLA
jgi:arylsulfatase A-like enzyme